MKRLPARASAKIGRQSLRALRGAADLRPPGPSTTSAAPAGKPVRKPRSGVVRRAGSP